MGKRKTLRFGRLSIRVEVGSLSNGITVASARDATARKVALGIGVVNGRAMLRPGIRHFLEHCVFKGSAAIAARELVQSIEFDGAEINATTDREFTLYELKAPSWVIAAKHFPSCAEVFLNPLFDEGEIEKERRVIITEQKHRFCDDPQGYAHDAVYKLLFSRSAVGSQDTAENFRHITRDNLANTHHRFYRNPGRLIVVGAGLLRHDELAELSKRSFGALVGRRVQDVNDLEVIRKNGLRSHRVERSSNTASFLTLGFNVSPIMATERDRSAFLLLMSVLGDAMSSRLYQALREENGIGYEVGSWHDFSKSYAVAAFEAACESRGTLDRAEEIIRAEIELLQRTPISRRELRGHRRKLRTEVRDDIDNPEKLRDELFRQVFRGRAERLYAQYQEFPSVTAADIQRVAQKYLDLNSCAVVRIEGGDVL